jgi:hypothetical protein
MSNALTVDLGNRVESTVSFTNAAGTATDPDLVTFQLAEPDGTETDFVLADGEVSNPAVGTWVFSYVPTVAGRYVVRCAGVGTVDAAQEKVFVVLESEFTTPA